MRQQSYRRRKPSHSGGWPSGPSPTTGDQPNKRFWPLVALAALEFACFVVMSLLWLSPYSVMPYYQGLDTETVVKIQIATTKIPHLYFVQVTFPAQSSNLSKSTECFMKQGDNLTLQGDILLFVSSKNNTGLHSGFRLVKLKGCYLDAHFQDQLNFNTGEDKFFTMVEGQRWFSQIEGAQAFHSISITLPANLPVGQSSKTYVVRTSQNKPYVALSQ